MSDKTSEIFEESTSNILRDLSKNEAGLDQARPNSPEVSDIKNQAEILKKYQNGEATEEDLLRALGRKFLKFGAQAESTAKNPELDIKVRHFSVYTRRQGKLNVYFAFTPVNQNEWKEKVPNSPILENNEYHSGK